MKHRFVCVCVGYISVKGIVGNCGLYILRIGCQLLSLMSEERKISIIVIIKLFLRYLVMKLMC